VVQARVDGSRTPVLHWDRLSRPKLIDIICGVSAQRAAQ
jgi:hypothetical protein